MGLSSQKSSKKPIYSAEITGAANNISQAYTAQQPKVAAASDALGGFLPGLVDQYQQGDPNVKAAAGYNADVLGGKYLEQGNPYLQAMIDKTNASVRNGAQAALGTRGLTGGSDYTGIISKALADNETGLRYQDYGSERARMDQAAALAPNLSAAKYQPISAISDILQAQLAPIQAATGAGAGIGGLLGQYVKQTSSPSLAQMAGQAAQIASIFSDRQLKTDIRKLGEFSDGLGRYAYRYIWGGPEREGVMADEVARFRPWALGPTINGFATVNMGAL